MTIAELSTDRRRFLHGIFTTAIEGGINYWAQTSAYHWSDNGSDDINGFYADITECEEGDTNLRIDLDTMARGVQLFVKYCRGEITTQGEPVPEADQQEIPEGHYWREFLVAEQTQGRDGDYDAGVADEIVQFGLFGKSIYG